MAKSVIILQRPHISCMVFRVVSAGKFLNPARCGGGDGAVFVSRKRLSETCVMNLPHAVYAIERCDLLI